MHKYLETEFFQKTRFEVLVFFSKKLKPRILSDNQNAWLTVFFIPKKAL